MKKQLITALAIGLMATGGLIASATAGATTTVKGASTTATTAPPAQGNGKRAVFMYVDTVVGVGAVGLVGCSQNSQIPAGDTVVFRMDGVQVTRGGIPLTPANTASVKVRIPGVKNAIAFVYGAHGKASYWTAAWVTKKSTTKGTVNFVVTAHTKPHGAIPAQKGTFTQAGLAPQSLLTIT